jgi:hypothetical protein
LALASYTVTTLLTPVPAPAPMPIHQSEPAPTPPLVENHEPPPAVNPSDPGQGTVPSGNSEDHGPGVEFTPNYEKPQDLILKGAHLTEVLTLLQRSMGMKVTIAPGMPDPVVDVEYRHMTAMEMLRDLGQRYQFTAFDQGDGSVVVYPAVDTTGGNGPVRKLGG